MSTAHPLRFTSQALAPLVLHARVIANSGGGPDKTIMRSAQYANPDRLRMAAMYIHPRRDKGIETIRQQARAADMRLFEVAETCALDVGSIRAAIQLCRQQRVTVWHAHDYKTDVLGLIVRRFWPMKLVSTVHGFTRETIRTRFYAQIDSWALRRYDHVIAVSPQLVQHCYEHGVSPRRISYIPNAIELNDYHRTMSMRERRTALGVSPDPLIMGVIGRLSIEKGVDRAIRLLAYLRQGYPNLELHIVGDGPQRKTLEKLAKNLNVSTCVRFWGWQEHVLPFYEMMNVLLLPSRTEGLPNVVLEAMAMGVPVAATSVGGVRDLLAWGACGVVLDHDESTWPNHIAPLLASTDRRDEFARRARARVEKHYTFAGRMAKVFSVYSKVLRIASLNRPQKQLRQAA